MSALAFSRTDDSRSSDKGLATEAACTTSSRTGVNRIVQVAAGVHTHPGSSRSSRSNSRGATQGAAKAARRLGGRRAASVIGTGLRLAKMEGME
jgi:hypothetical protein